MTTTTTSQPDLLPTVDKDFASALNAATRRVTAFDCYGDLLTACRRGYTPTLPRTYLVDTWDEQGRWTGKAPDEDGSTRELLRQALTSAGLLVWPR